MPLRVTDHTGRNYEYCVTKDGTLIIDGQVVGSIARVKTCCNGTRVQFTHPNGRVADGLFHSVADAIRHHALYKKVAG